MLLLTYFLSIACFEHCFLALRRLQWVYALWYRVCLTNVCGASTRNFTFFRRPGCKCILALFASVLLCYIVTNKRTY